MLDSTVTVLVIPTAAVANAPAALPVLRVTVSPLTTPTSAALAVFNVAVVFPSYGLFAAVMPLTVRPFPVMSAVAVGCVSV